MTCDRRLSKKHGVNPSLEKCFWCGEAMGVVLCGRIGGKKDLEAPASMVLGLTPCSKCKEKFSKGVHVVEVDEDGSRFDGNRAFLMKSQDGKEHWPTGRYAVLREGCIKGIPKGGTCMVDKETMDWILGKGKNG